MSEEQEAPQVGRQYPIKRDGAGRPARRRCFEAFDQGAMPADVWAGIGISVRTARRYYADWKKLGGRLQDREDELRRLLHTPAVSAETLSLLSEHTGMTESEIAEYLQKPWGLRRLMHGKWPDYVRERQRDKLQAILEVAIKIACLYDKKRVPLGDILSALDEVAARCKGGQRRPGNEQLAP